MPRSTLTSVNSETDDDIEGVPCDDGEGAWRAAFAYDIDADDEHNNDNLESSTRRLLV